MSSRLVINERKPPQRKYIIAETELSWLGRITDDLAGGLNVVVASMSTEALERLTKHVLAAGVVQAHEIMKHTSKTSDAVKRELHNVDAHWVKFRLVVFSPSIESGTDCSVKHFHKMYVFCCRMSTTPMGLVQMTGRVRKLANQDIHVCTSRGMCSPSKHAHTTVEEARNHLRWLHQAVQKLSNTTPTLVYDWEAGRHAWVMLPPDDTMFEVMAHAEAARVNKELRFIETLRDLLEQAGHQVLIAEGGRAPRGAEL